MYRVEMYARVRRACRVEGMSTREASRVFGLDRKTVRKMLSFSVPPGYRRGKPPRRPKLGPFTGIIDRILEDDRTSHHKQRHTAKRIFDRLRDEYGFTGGYTIVKDYVREQGLRSREVFVPLSHSPGHAQADFGEAMAVIGGALRKIHFLAFDLPHSDGCFVAAYPAETTEAFCDGHNAAFAFFGGVPRDNTKLAVARILGDRKRANPSSRSFSPTICSRTVRPAGQGPTRAVAGRAELPGPRPACRELRGACLACISAPGGATAGPQGDHPRSSIAACVASEAAGDRCRGHELLRPLHYLPLIEQKIGGSTRPRGIGGLGPGAFITLRRLLEARMGKAGKREYVQVLRLLETFRLEEVEGAVGDALRLGAIGRCGEAAVLERRPPR